MIKRQILLFLYSFLGITLFTFAQSNSPIKNIYAVYMVHIPGNIPVDRNGNAISTFYTSTIIYVESTPTFILWVKVWKNNKSYSLPSTPIANSYLDVGTKTTSNEKMIIRVTKENKL